MTLQVTPEQYIFPPRSQDAIPRADTDIFGQLGWIAQLKYNDSHALVKYCVNGNIELWNRHAEKFRTYTAPDHLIEELRQIGTVLGVEPGKVTILDGGVLDQKHAAIKDTIALWDVLVKNDTHLLGTTYAERHQQIIEAAFGFPYSTPWHYNHHNFGIALTANVFVPESHELCDWDNMWDMIEQVNKPYTIGKPTDKDYSCRPILEGLFFKDPNGILGMGFNEKNNTDWSIRSRVKTGRHAF